MWPFLWRLLFVAFRREKKSNQNKRRKNREKIEKKNFDGDFLEMGGEKGEGNAAGGGGRKK